MNKRILAALLAALLLLGAIAPAALASEASSGTCGEGITWSYASNVLTISGAGDMDDGAPWSAYKDKIEQVIFTGGVTKVGAKAFENYDRLETVDFGDSMREIGSRAFYDCNDIVEIRMPQTFKTFGESCFAKCQSLERVICEGYMPSFKSGCFNTGNYISVFFPPNNPWSSEYYSPVIRAYGGMLGFMMASEEIMQHGFPETEPTEDASEEKTEATQAPEQTTALEAQDVTAPTQAAVVVAVDVPQTVQTLPPETAPAAQPQEEAPIFISGTEPAVLAAEEVPTEAPAEIPTEPEGPLFTQPTEPPQEEPGISGKSWIGLVMIAAVLTFLISGAMIFRSSRRGGRYR